MTDPLGNLVRVRRMPDQRYDTVEAPLLIDGIVFNGLIADKAFDSNAPVAELSERDAKIVISQYPGRAQRLEIDAAMYAWGCRRSIERGMHAFAPQRPSECFLVSRCDRVSIQAHHVDVCVKPPATRTA